jgi:hypothetical protein
MLLFLNKKKLFEILGDYYGCLIATPGDFGCIVLPYYCSINVRRFNIQHK